MVYRCISSDILRLPYRLRLCSSNLCDHSGGSVSCSHVLCPSGSRSPGALPDASTPLAALSWKGMHAEATLSDAVPISAELRLQRLSIQRGLELHDDLQGAPGIVTSLRRWPPVYPVCMVAHALPISAVTVMQALLLSNSLSH